MSSTQDPASIPERQAKETTKEIAPSEQKQKNPVNPESVPRSGAGVVTEIGEVLDDAGKAVSNISDSKNLKDLVGNTVNPAGDVVSSTGDVLGKTVPLDLGGEKQGEEKQTEEKPGEEEHDSHDEEHSEYTTEPPEKSQKSGGLGLGGKSKDDAPDTEKSADEATDEVPEGQTEDVQQKDTDINLEDRDVSTTGKDETDETKDELKEVPPEEIKDETTKTEDAAKDVQPDEQVDTDKAKNEVPKTEAPEVETESKAPEAEAEDKAPEVEAEDKAPEVDTESKAPEVETDDKAKTEAPEGELPEREVPEREAPKAEGKAPEDEVPKAEEATDEEAAEGEEGTKTPLDFSVLKGTKVDKEGNLVNDKGHLIGRVTEGDIKQLIGMKCDENGTIWGECGKAEPLPEWERGEPKDFSILKGCKVNKDGNLLNDKGDLVGRVAEGEIKQLVGLKADENGNLWTDGKIVGRADPLPEWEREEKKDYSALKGCKVNKAGNLVNNDGDIIGKVIEGELKRLIGKRADENGDIWNDAGEVIGKGEPVPDSEREDTKAFVPFENFLDATVEPDGRVLFEGRQVGVVVEGDPKRLKGSKVDEDGDILDRRGNVVGKTMP